MPIREFEQGADPDLWADALCALRRSDDAAAKRLFRADTVIAWDPQEDDLRHDELRFLLRWWRALALAHDGLPPASLKLDPLTLRPALGHLATLQPVEGGRDFRFRLYGSLIADRSGFDMTGKLASAMPSSPDTVTFLTATYRAVTRACMPLYTEHTPWSGQSVTRWFRLLLPFVGAEGAVERIVVGNLPGANRPASHQLLDELTMPAAA